MTTFTDEKYIADLRSKFPQLPDEYFRYLAEVGWGEARSGRMIYQGPIRPREIYGKKLEGSPVLILGDDTQGYCLGVDTSTGQLGEFSDAGNWHPWPEGRGFLYYVKEPEE